MKSSDQTPQSRIEFLRRFILLHSYLYYELDRSLVTDHFYDERCKELVKLQNEHGVTGQFADVFSDFDGSTGFDLYHRLDGEGICWVRTIAWRLTKRAD